LSYRCRPTVSCWSLVLCCLTVVVLRSVVDLWCSVVLPLSSNGQLSISGVLLSSYGQLLISGVVLSYRCRPTVSCWSLVFCCLTVVVLRSVVDLWRCVVLPLSSYGQLLISGVLLSYRRRPTVSCWSLALCCLTVVVQRSVVDLWCSVVVLRSVVDLWCCVVLPLSYWSSLTVIMFSSVLELWWTCATVLAAVTVDARVSNNTVHVDGVWYVTLTLSVQMSTQVSVHIEMIRYSAPKELISCLVVSDV